ncbi:putative phosphomannomutase [Amphibalanus amphitrite]|uniref:Phosphomannomutase n=1 Tax=Amphibalanus amphitrite TaxID=1232801 RepID=A0A6A4VXL8_AMPAM|nr:putative phosphomannomutase [Amphibalanus amphitrite]
MAPRKPLLLLFDVDGTLTKARQEITPDMTGFLSSLREHACVGVVGGSDLPKICQQLAGGDEKAVHSMCEYVFAENGLVAFKGGELIHKADLVGKLGDEFLQRFINFTLGYLSKVQLPLKRGNFIEFRNGMINISPIGRSCSQAERDAFVVYDTEHGVRSALVAALNSEFRDANLSVCIGKVEDGREKHRGSGQISVDVFPRGWDKTYSLQFVEKEGFEAIHFFGDKTSPGGNDHAIYEDPRTVGHSVTDPSDARRQVEELLKLR